MRFKAADIGLMVRPKTITHLFLWKHDENLEEWWKQSIFQYRWKGHEKKQQLTLQYKASLPDLFKDLQLGNAHKNPGESYVATIKSFVILHRGSLYHLETKERADSFEREFKRRFGPNAYLPVVAVGLKFYKNISVSADGGLSPGEAWGPTDDSKVTWFYQPKEIVTLTNIIAFETLTVGKLVLMKKVDGIVTSVKELSKPQFYSANSCVSTSVTLLTTNVNYIRLIPDKRFTILNPEDKASIHQTNTT